MNEVKTITPVELVQEVTPDLDPKSTGSLDAVTSGDKVEAVKEEVNG